MSSYKKVFCSFGDFRLKKSLARISRQAFKMKVYDQIYIQNEFDLDEDFSNRFKDKLNKYTRGFGYWCWKPQIILQILNKMEDGDILQYTDAGCYLNKNGRERLIEYFEIVSNSSSGIMLFRPEDKKDVSLGKPFYENYEYQYTKADLFEYLDVLNNNNITLTNQYAATAIFIKKTAENIDFIKQWIDVFKNDFSYIDDSISKYPNFEGFIAHRHDQSIISILAKKRGVEDISINEIFTTGNWSELNKFPIWSKRDKNFGFIHKTKVFIYPMYKFLFNKHAN